MAKDSQQVLDRTDLRILELLQKEGRLTNARLAEHLHLSETPVWRRLRRLEEEGYITGYQANLDRRKLGFGLIAFVQINFANPPESSPRNSNAPSNRFRRYCRVTTLAAKRIITCRSSRRISTRMANSSPMCCASCRA